MTTEQRDTNPGAHGHPAATPPPGRRAGPRRGTSARPCRWKSPTSCSHSSPLRTTSVRDQRVDRAYRSTLLTGLLILIRWAWSRRIDALSAFALATLAVSAAVSAWSGDPRFLLARGAQFTAPTAAAFLVSLLIRRPIAFTLARGLDRKDTDPRGVLGPPLQTQTRFRQGWQACTAIWGVGLLINSVILAVFADGLPVDTVPAGPTELSLRSHGRVGFSAAFVVEKLKQFVGCKLDLLVIKFRCSEMASDKPGSMQAQEIPEPEREQILRFVGCSDLQPEVPLAVLVPGVGLQEQVLVFGARLRLLPPAANYVAPGVDQMAGVDKSLLVDLILRHASSLRRRSETTRGMARRWAWSPARAFACNMCSGRRGERAFRQKWHQPPMAFSIAAMSILLIGIIASKARLALSPPALRESVNTLGVICQDTPHLSLHQPHWLSSPPLSTIAFQ